MNVNTDKKKIKIPGWGILLIVLSIILAMALFAWVKLKSKEAEEKLTA